MHMSQVLSQGTCDVYVTGDLTSYSDSGPSHGHPYREKQQITIKAKISLRTNRSGKN